MPSKYPLNIVINHNADYYEDDYDPYKELDRATAVQCVTIETLIDSFCGEIKLNSYYVIMKELWSLTENVQIMEDYRKK